jgi:hypothetical protein
MSPFERCARDVAVAGLTLVLDLVLLPPGAWFSRAAAPPPSAAPAPRKPTNVYTFRPRRDAR